MEKTPEVPTADEIAERADRGEDVSKYFSDKGRMKQPVHSVNVDFAVEMLQELDEVASELNISRGGRRNWASVESSGRLDSLYGFHFETNAEIFLDCIQQRGKVLRRWITSATEHPVESLLVETCLVSAIRIMNLRAVSVAAKQSIMGLSRSFIIRIEACSRTRNCRGELQF